jgi:SAM-dependent methyltransferase
LLIVLDIGTGTGTWAIDFADEFPSSYVTGTDLSPIQPRWTPPNCIFEIDDADTADWSYEPNSFDFIHVRSLFGCITSWPAFYKECFKLLKPGGYIEQAEFAPGFTSDDGSVTETNSVMGEWGSVGRQVFEKMGKEIMVLEKMGGWIAEAGFEDVNERQYKWPIGPWAKDAKLKEIGLWTRAHLDAGLEGWSLRGLTGLLGWTREEVLAYCAGMRRDMEDPKLHGIHEMRVVYARKPLDAGSGEGHSAAS